MYARCRVAEVEGGEACSTQRRVDYRRTQEVGMGEVFLGTRLLSIGTRAIPSIQGVESPECVNLRAFVMRSLAG